MRSSQLKTILHLGIVVAISAFASRNALAVDRTWNKQVGGNFHTAANWTPAGVPGAADKAIITLAGTYTVSLSANVTCASLVVGGSSGSQTLDIGSYDVVVNGASSVGATGQLDQSGGSLKIAGGLQVNGTLNWNGGAQTGSGTTVIAKTAVLNLKGGTLDGRTITNLGKVNVLDYCYLSAKNGSIINNESGALIDITGYSGYFGWNDNTTPLTFNNKAGAILRKRTISDTFYIYDSNFNNAGTVDCQKGTIDVAKSYYANATGGTSTGTFNVLAGANLEFGGTPHTLNNAKLTGNGALTVGGSNLTVNNALTIATGFTLNQTSGILKVTGALQVNGMMNWSGGTQSGVGSTTIAANAILNLKGGTLDGRTLINFGKINVLDYCYLSTKNGSIINNESGALIDITGYSGYFGWNDNTTPLTFNNKAGAILRKRTISDIFYIYDSNFNNAGTVDCQKGTIDVAKSYYANATGGTSTGTFNVLAGANLEFGGTPHTLNNAKLTGSGNLTVAGSNLTVNSAFTVVSGATLSQTGGIFKIMGALQINAGATLNQSGGTMQVTGNVPLNGTWNWNGGAQTGAGSTTIAANAILNLKGGTLDGRTLINFGKINVLDYCYLSTKNGSIINNESGALIDITGYSGYFGWNDNTTPLTFNNKAGAILRKRTISDIFYIYDSNFNNAGTVDCQKGTIDVAKSYYANATGGTSTGTFNVLAGANLEFGGTPHTLNNAKLTGAGTATFAGSTVTLIGTTTIPTSMILEQTSGAVNGAGTLQVNGKFNWSGGTQSGAGITSIVSGATMNLVANYAGATFAGRSVNNAGTVTLTTGYPSILNITGSYTQTSTGRLNMDVGGAKDYEFDQLNASGAVSLAGPLAVSRINGFNPVECDAIKAVTYNTRTGSFASISAPFAAVYNANDLTLALATAIPSAPTLISPANAATLTNGALQVSVTDTNTSRKFVYKVEVLQSGVVIKTFDQKINPVSWDKPFYVSGETATVSTAGLPPGTYQWRAQAAPQCGSWGPASATRTFSFAGIVLDPCSPITAAFEADDTVFFSLKSVPASPDYWITIQKKEQVWDCTATLKRNGTVITTATGSGDIILHATNIQAGDYVLEVTANSAGTAVIRACANLPQVEIGKQFVGKIYHNDGHDWAQIDVPAGVTKLDFTAETVGNISTLEVWRGSLSGPSLYSASHSFNPPVELTVNNPQPGRYYLRLWDHGDLAATGSQVRDYSISAITIGNTTPVVGGISPNHGGNNGSVTLTINGSNLDPAATVKLTKNSQPTITASVVNGNEARSLLNATFDLTGKTIGFYNVIVTNPNGQVVTFPNAFTIESGGSPQIWVNIVGRDAIRPGQPATYTINYGNSGSVDAYDCSLLIKIPNGATFERFPEPNFGVPGLQMSQKVIEGQEIVIPLWRYSLLASSNSSLPLVLQIPANYQQSQAPISVELSTTRSTPFSRTGDPGRIGESPAFKAALETITNHYNTEIEPYNPDVEAQAKFNREFNSRIGPKLQGELNEIEDWANGPTWIFVWHVAVKAAKEVVKDIIAEKLIPEPFDEPTAKIFDRLNAPEEASLLDLWLRQYRITDSDTILKILERDQKNPRVVQAADPNEKVGATGFGPSHYVPGGQPLPYTILFENKSNATAAAQTVVITDQLNLAQVEFDSFSLGAINFGNKKLNPPAGSNSYVGFVDLRPATNLIVRVTAKLARGTGLITWRFESIDPVTGNPTDDPIAGFLPPNITSPEGEGSVSFTVMPKMGLASSTVIRNKARIIFDANAPIDTEEWFNTVDGGKPRSVVAALSSIQNTNSFQVRWSGDDSHSGLSGYTIFVSDNGGAYSPWLSNTTATTGVFEGVGNHSYRFYSIARDNAGSTEETPSTPDANTTISLSVSGRVYNERGMAVGGATISRGNGSAPVLSNGAGYYTLSNVSDGSHVLTVSKSGYSFLPASRNVTVRTGNVAAQNFIGKTGVSLSGRVFNSAGVAISGVRVTCSGVSAPELTNNAGYYAFIGLQPGNVTLTASKSGYRFTPATKTVAVGTIPISSQNFLGATGYSISGRIADSSGVGQSGITVKRSGSTSTVITNGAGYYTFTDVLDGSVTITASGSGKSFTPASRTFEMSGANIANQNFTATPGFNIIGRIATSAGIAVMGVTVNRSGSNVPTVTNTAGYYVFSGVPIDKYVLTPIKAGFTFTPGAKTISVINADINGQNFIAIER